MPYDPNHVGVSDSIDDVNWKEICLFIFDVDGTLYDQKKMRTKMMIELAKYYSVRPWKLNELKILKDFREHREHLGKMESTMIGSEQYNIYDRSNLKIDEIKEIVAKWIRSEPLRHIYKYTYENIRQLFLYLHQQNISTAVLSDYYPNLKMKAMELPCNHMYSSESPEINSLKPNPKGIEFILKDLGLSRERTVFIGDRNDTDGLASQRSGVEFIKVDRLNAAHTYSRILQKLQDVR